MTDSVPIEKKHSWQMFDRIAASYDVLNRILSAGIDKRWRQQIGKYLPDTPRDLSLLDLATGTGDQLLALEKVAGTRISNAVGIDLAEEMLARGQEKLKQKGLSNRYALRKGDAQQIALPDDAVHVVTISFGIRNVSEPLKALKEIARVLRPEGRAIILEFSLPRNMLLRTFYLFYFRHILPWIGGMISGEREAYQYLNKTVESFPYGEQFCSLMREAGLIHVSCYPLTLGIASIYVGTKRSKHEQAETRTTNSNKGS